MMPSRRFVWMLLFLFGWASSCWSQEINGGEGGLPFPESKLAFVAYDLQSLLIDQDGNPPDFAPLIKLIQRFVAPESWETAGGAGRIYGINGSLLVYQNRQAQLEIGGFVNVLRRAENFSQRSSGQNGQQQFYGDALRAFAGDDYKQGEPFARVYPRGDLPNKVTFTTDRELRSLPIKSRSLIELLKTATPADSWEDQGGVGSIIDLPAADCTIIIQTNTRHEQIGEMLTALRKDRNKIGLLNPLEFRIVEYSLIDQEGKLLSTEQLRDVAVKIQDDLQNLGWRFKDRFIIVDQELTISQTIEGHEAMKRAFTEWGLQPIVILPPAPADAGLTPRVLFNRPWMQRGPDAVMPPKPLIDPQPLPDPAPVVPVVPGD